MESVLTGTKLLNTEVDETLFPTPLQLFSQGMLSLAGLKIGDKGILDPLDGHFSPPTSGSYSLLLEKVSCVEPHLALQSSLPPAAVAILSSCLPAPSSQNRVP